MVSLNDLAFPITLFGQHLKSVIKHFSEYLDEHGDVYFYDKLSLVYHKHGIEFIFNNKMYVETIHVHVTTKHSFICDTDVIKTLLSLRSKLGQPHKVKEPSLLPVLGFTPKTETYLIHDAKIVFTYDRDPNILSIITVFKDD